MSLAASSLEFLESARHEQVSVFSNSSLGVSAIIAVHNTSIGPALGGSRMRAYSSLEEAMADVLNLSRAMSFKNALCGINFGGGKSVIVSDGRHSDRSELFQWFGECVDSLGGKYITAEDMNTTVADMSEVAKATSHVAGTDPAKGGGGDPSPWTALGVFEGIKSSLRFSKGSAELKGVRVGIEGVGNVGSNLAKLLHQAGAELVVEDIRPEATSLAAKDFGAQVVENIYLEDCEVLAPCAAGGAISLEVAQSLKAKIVAGGANNQLVPGAGEILKERGVTYAPDFAINAGGVILCADEFETGGYSEARVRERVLNISKTVTRVLELAKSSDELPQTVAEGLALERIESAD